MTEAASGGGGGFFVQPGALAQTARDLLTVGSELDGLSSKPPHIDPASMGGGNLAAAVEDFYHQWAYAVSQLNSSLNAVATNMAQAATNYAASDGYVAGGAVWK